METPDKGRIYVLDGTKRDDAQFKIYKLFIARIFQLLRIVLMDSNRLQVPETAIRKTAGFPSPHIVAFACVSMSVSVRRTLETYSLSHFQVHNTVLLTILVCCALGARTYSFCI